jgi:crotonobetainyl-CoA:carnitine CoA-transferase CaiB-like acyl-CoA transferase
MDGAMTKGMRALEGLKILDLTRLLPGAYCSLLLADQGAEVIKIEQPGAGDYNRQFAPINIMESGSFLLLNRNKKSITLNLKSDAGRAVFLKLVDRADVVLEGFRPGVMARLGLDYETLAKRNPKIIFCALSGYGQDGPYAQVSGHDMNYLAEVGALQLFARKGQQPIVPGLSIADVGGGSLMAVFGILTAVLARQHTGRGQMVDVSMFDGALTWLTYHGADFLFGAIEPKGGERPFLGGAPCYNIYRCADGKDVTLGIIEPHFWQRFCDFIERPGFIDNQWPEPDEADRQYAALATIFKTRPRNYWVSNLMDIDVPVGAVNSMAEAFDHPQVRHRELLQEINHPVEGRIAQLGFPVKFSDTPGQMRIPPPLLGQHTSEILQSLGYSDAEIANLGETAAI